jgi:hypothetical protein
MYKEIEDIHAKALCNLFDEQYYTYYSLDAFGMYWKLATQEDIDELVSEGCFEDTPANKVSYEDKFLIFIG